MVILTGLNISRRQLPGGSKMDSNEFTLLQKRIRRGRKREMKEKRIMLHGSVESYIYLLCSTLQRTLWLQKDESCTPGRSHNHTLLWLSICNHEAAKLSKFTHYCINVFLSSNGKIIPFLFHLGVLYDFAWLTEKRGTCKANHFAFTYRGTMYIMDIEAL